MARAHARRDAGMVARIGAVPLGCVIGLVLLLAIGGLTWHASPTLGHAAHAAPRDVGAIPGSDSSVPSSSAAAAAFARAVPVSPTRIEIPKLHADAPIVKVGTTPDNELDVPENPRVVGWWSPGAKPGAKVGTALLAGHINYAGQTGSLAELGKLSPGDEVTIVGKYNADGKKSQKFTVEAVRTYAKTSLPYAQIFDQKSLGRLAIVTCGGPFDNATGNYLDNIVVFAVPA